MNHTQNYTGTKNNIFDEIHESRILCVIGATLEDKCLCFLEMSHLIASAYNKVCIDLTRYNFTKIFFLLQSDPPQNPVRHIMSIE